MLAHLLFAGSVFSLVNGQSPTTTSLEPLASKHFTYPNIPFQVTGDNGGGRGPQFGYNLCNSTTEGPNSLCQTMFVNDITDFCMWSSNQPDDTVGASEAREVAWCTKPGHGTRIIPSGAITGAQFLYAKDYLQVVGYIDQTKVNLAANDDGGELDPHGDDEQGNPLGGIAFTNGFTVNANAFDAAFQAKKPESQDFTQVIEWVDFIGDGMFCLKMCNPSDRDAPHLCNHIYDEIGCSYNALANYGAINGTFTVCDSDDMADPGVFTTNGKATTWTQPFSGPITVPYTTTIPSSSNCHTYASTDLFAEVATASLTSSGTSVTPTGSSSSGNTGSSTSGNTGASTSGNSNGSPTTSRSGSAQGASSTGGAVTVGALMVNFPLLATVVVGVVFFILA